MNGVRTSLPRWLLPMTFLLACGLLYGLVQPSAEHLVRLREAVSRLGMVLTGLCILLSWMFGSPWFSPRGERPTPDWPWFCRHVVLWFGVWTTGLGIAFTWPDLVAPPDRTTSALAAETLATLSATPSRNQAGSMAPAGPNAPANRKTADAEVSTGKSPPAPAASALSANEKSAFEQSTFVATILAVVLAVMTLVATKTAADVKSDLHELVKRNEAANSRQMESALWRGRQQLLMMRLEVARQNLGRHFEPGVLAGMAAAAQEVDDAFKSVRTVAAHVSADDQPHTDWMTVGHHCDRAARRLDQLNLAKYQHMSVLDKSMLVLLGEFGTEWLDLLAAVRSSGRSMSERQQKAYGSLYELAHQLRRLPTR